MNKPTHAKPQLYACYFFQLKEIAVKYGYNLVIHGSMNRDLDLVAVPWADTLGDHLTMVYEFVECLGGRLMDQSLEKRQEFARKFQGRMNYVINLNRGGYKRNEIGEIVDPIEYTPDPEYYLDIAVIPTSNVSLANILDVVNGTIDDHFKSDDDAYLSEKALKVEMESNLRNQLNLLK